MDKNPPLVFHADWFDIIEDLPKEQQLEVYRAIMLYAFRGEMTENSMARAITALMRKFIDSDRAKYKEICAKRKEAIKRRWEKEKNTSDTNVYSTIQKNTSDTNTNTSTNTINQDQDQDQDQNQSAKAELNINFSRARDEAAAVDENLIEKFFAPNNQASLESLAMNMHCDIATMRNIAGGIVEEWKLRDVRHNDYKDAAQHLINTIRRKVFDPQERRRNPATANSGLGAGEWRDGQGRRRYARSDVIVPESAPPRPSDNHYWCEASLQWEKAI